MIWHTVRLDLSGIDEQERAALEASLEALVALDEVAWLRVARDIEQPHVTGLITVHRDRDALEAYRVEPRHQLVVDRLTELGVGRARFDIETDDDVDELP